jgi:hypothetical protein
VLVEPMVLRGEHGVDEGLGRIREPDRSVVLGGLIDPAAEDESLEDGLASVLAVPAAPAGIRRAAVGPGGQEEGAHAVGERG